MSSAASLHAGENPAHATQFKVLEHVFPVLRHDAVKPISNAKLAVAMLTRAMSSDTDTAGARSQRLVDDVDQMLDDGVDAMRSLGNWLADSGDLEDLHNLLYECRKLVFTHLLLSGKKILLPEETDTRRVVRVFSARYVLLAWLLHTLQAMEEGGSLQLDYDDTGRLTAAVSGPDAQAQAQHSAHSHANAQTRTPLCSPFSEQEAQDIASRYGWVVEGNAHNWCAAMPMVR